jgi:hypothetical protein
MMVNLKVSYKMGYQVDLENLLKIMEVFMRAIGKTVFLMDLEKSPMEMEILMKVNF